MDEFRWYGRGGVAFDLNGSGVSVRPTRDVNGELNGCGTVSLNTANPVMFDAQQFAEVLAYYGLPNGEIPNGFLRDAGPNTKTFGWMGAEAPRSIGDCGVTDPLLLQAADGGDLEGAPKVIPRRGRRRDRKAQGSTP